MNQKELTDEQQDLLSYMTKTEHSELAALFNEKMTNIVGLEAFVRDLARTCRGP